MPIMFRTSAIAAPTVSTAKTASVVAVSVADPNPSNLDTYWTTQTANPSNPTSGIGQACYLGQQNVAGNDILVIASCANDFNTGPDPAGNTISSVFDPIHGPYTFLGSLLNNGNDCNTDVGFYIMRNAQPLQIGTAWSGQGAVSSGGILTLSGSVSGTMRLNQRILSASTPAVSNTGGETIILSKLTGTMGQAGSTYQLSGGIGATTFGAEAMTTRDFITAQTTVRTNPAQRDYPGMLAIELFGTDGVNAYFGGQNYTTTAGSSNMSTGSIVGPSSGGLFIAWHCDGGADNAPLTPTLDSGWSGQAVGIYNLGSAIELLAYQHFSNLGTRAGTASLNSANNCMSAGIMFPDHP